MRLRSVVYFALLLLLQPSVGEVISAETALFEPPQPSLSTEAVPIVADPPEQDPPVTLPEEAAVDADTSTPANQSSTNLLTVPPEKVPKGKKKLPPRSPKAPESSRRPEARRKAPQFDPRATGAISLTNLTSVPGTNQINPEWRLPPTQPFTLGPSDAIDIQLLGVRASSTQTLIGPDGKIYYHLLPGLDVWGLTLDETRQLLERELLEYLRIPPKVSVALRSVGSKKIWLLGRLNSPGMYGLGTPMTLLEALAMAGGPMVSGGTDLADLRNSFLIRNGQMLPVDFYRLLRSGDMSQNIYLQPDDFVYLPSAYTQEIYVLGAVASPLPIAYRDQVSLMTAIVSAGGPGAGAQLKQVAIVRGSLSDPKIAIVDFGDILQGRAPDILLEPRDIVYVPRTRYQFLGRYLSMILSTFIMTVATNAGVQAVNPDAPAVGVGNIPPPSQ